MPKNRIGYKSRSTQFSFATLVYASRLFHPFLFLLMALTVIRGLGPTFVLLWLLLSPGRRPRSVSLPATWWGLHPWLSWPRIPALCSSHLSEVWNPRGSSRVGCWDGVVWGVGVGWGDLVTPRRGTRVVETLLFMRNMRLWRVPTLGSVVSISSGCFSSPTALFLHLRQAWLSA